MSIENLLMPSCVILLVAPPAFGKTHRLCELYASGEKKMIFISPLRALANEFALKVRGSILVESSLNSRSQFEKFFSLRKSALIVTPELLNDFFYENLDFQKEKCFVVLDEFHLFYRWGIDFRPVLFESLMGLACTQAPMLCLSATINEDVFESFKRDFQGSFTNIYLLDFGNHTLKYLPKKIHYYPLSKKMLIRRFLYEAFKNQNQTLLLFCQYRKEVDFWGQYLKREKINVLTCKGGEVLAFTDKLKIYSPPGCIVATTSLSHGVNLPSISKVFLSYKVGDKDYWPQMIARAGRDGKDFEIFCMDLFMEKTFMFKMKRTVAAILFDQYLKCRDYLKLS